MLKILKNSTFARNHSIVLRPLTVSDLSDLIQISGSCKEGVCTYVCVSTSHVFRCTPFCVCCVFVCIAFVCLHAYKLLYDALLITGTVFPVLCVLAEYSGP